MIVSALDVVTMTSRRAFTSAEQLIYVSAIWSGCASRKRLNCSGGQLSSRLHPASMSGRTTIFSGDNIFAVSAMNLTPASTLAGRLLAVSTLLICFDSAREGLLLRVSELPDQQTTQSIGHLNDINQPDPVKTPGPGQHRQ